MREGGGSWRCSMWASGSGHMGMMVGVADALVATDLRLASNVGLDCASLGVAAPVASAGARSSGTWNRELYRCIKRKRPSRSTINTEEEGKTDHRTQKKGRARSTKSYDNPSKVRQLTDPPHRRLCPRSPRLPPSRPSRLLECPTRKRRIPGRPVSWSMLAAPHMRPRRRGGRVRGVGGGGGQGQAPRRESVGGEAGGTGG